MYLGRDEGTSSNDKGHYFFPQIFRYWNNLVSLLFVGYCDLGKDFRFNFIWISEFPFAMIHSTDDEKNDHKPNGDIRSKEVTHIPVSTDKYRVTIS